MHRKHHSLRRKPSMYWDVPPKGFEHVSPAAFKESLAAQSIQYSSVPYVKLSKMERAVAVATQARRLYIGHLPDGSKENEVLEFFNHQFNQLPFTEKSKPGNAVTKCQLSMNKSYGFLQLRSDAEATEALRLDGVIYNGQKLKVRRPLEYEKLLDASESNDSCIAGLISNKVPDSPNKIFIGNMPTYVTEAQVKELLLSFGPLKGFKLVRDADTGYIKGYGFCEYMDPSMTQEAIAGLNGIELCGRNLLVQLACIGDKSGKTYGIKSTDYSNIDQIPNQMEQPTSVLRLHNIIKTEDFLNLEEYEDIVADIHEECSKYGQVKGMHVPRPSKSIASNASDVGNVYIEFESAIDCMQARNTLRGRQFNDRTVVTSFCDLLQYKAKCLQSSNMESKE